MLDDGLVHGVRHRNRLVFRRHTFRDAHGRHVRQRGVARQYAGRSGLLTLKLEHDPPHVGRELQRSRTLAGADGILAAVLSKGGGNDGA